MQSMTIAGMLERIRYDRSTPTRIQRVLGVVALCGLILILVLSAVLLFVPIGKKSYAALLTEAGSVKVGADVRIAGISVGKVTGLVLEPNQVRMTFNVDSDVRLGDSTKLQIRLLTAIGGHYVAVLPSGSGDLGGHPIPADRVQLPYSLIQAMQDAQRPASQIEGTSLSRSLADLTASLKNSPGSVDSLTSAMSAMSETLDKQADAVGAALTVAQEYLGVVSDSRSTLGQFIYKVGVMEDQVLGKRGELVSAIAVTDTVLGRIAALEPAYREYDGPILTKLVELANAFKEAETRLGAMASSLDEVGRRLTALQNPQGPELDQSALRVLTTCVPLPGKAC